MSIFKIDDKSSDEEIEDFYNLYVESFENLCVWNGQKIINLDDFITPSTNKKIFQESLESTTIGLGIIIYYTHNDDVITCIAFIEIDEPSKCYVKLKYLCGNQSTREEKIDGKSQGINMLDFIFREYKESVILIEPATSGLITYYTSYKRPIFPYNKNGLNETYRHLIYGNLRLLRENCFPKIFKSIGIIDKLSKVLQFTSITELYDRTDNLTDLKEKLIIKLDFLVKMKKMRADYYEQIMNDIMLIKYYDIQDILMTSVTFGKITSHSPRTYIGGIKKLNKYKKTNKKTNKKKIYKRRKTNKSN